MARVLHGLSIDSLPEPGEVKDDDQMVAYRKGDGKAYRANVSTIAMGGDVVDKIYPVGSIYMSVNQTDPSILFGGQWQEIQDCFLLAAGDNHAGGESGGSETVTLTSSQIPSHTHSIPALSGTAASTGAHTHSTYYCRAATSILDSSGSALSVGVASYNDGTQATQSAGAHTHSVTTNSSTTGSNGSGNSHSNMPPYMTVYMWQRTA